MLFGYRVRLLFKEFGVRFAASKVVIFLFYTVALVIDIIALVAILGGGGGGEAKSRLREVLLGRRDFTRSRGSETIRLRRELRDFSTSGIRDLRGVEHSISRGLRDVEQRGLHRLSRVQRAISRGLRGALRRGVGGSFSLIGRELRRICGKLNRVRALTMNINSLGGILSGIGAENVLNRVRLNTVLSRVLAGRRCRRGVTAGGNSGGIIRFTVGLPSSNTNAMCLPISSGFPNSACSTLHSTIRDYSGRHVRSTRGTLIRHVGNRTGSVRSGCVSPPGAARFTVVFLPFRKLCDRIIGVKLIRILRHRCGIGVTNPDAVTTLLGSLRVKFGALTIRGEDTRI